MYKMRFNRWGLKKNLNSKRIMDALEQDLALIHTSKCRFADGVKRQNYLRRLPKEKQMRLLNHVSQPLAAMESGRKAAILRPLTPPADFHAPEHCLYLLESYVKGSCEAKRWPRDVQIGFRNEDTMPQWCSSVMSAAVVLKDGKDAEAKRLLSCWIKQSHGKLQCQDPLLFPFIYTSILFFTRKRPDIARALLRAIVDVSETLPWAGSSHPLHLLLRIMVAQGPDGVIFNTSTTILAYIDYIHKALGAAYPIVQDMLSDAMGRLTRYEMMKPDEVVILGRRMVLLAELDHHDRCREHLYLKMRLARADLDTGDCCDARQAIEEILAPQNDTFRSERMIPELYMLMARIDESENRQEDAIQSALRAVVASIETFGDWSDWTVSSLAFYTQLLERFGKTDEAQRVKQDCDLAIGNLCSKFERSAKL